MGRFYTAAIDNPLTIGGGLRAFVAVQVTTTPIVVLVHAFELTVETYSSGYAEEEEFLHCSVARYVGNSLITASNLAEYNVDNRDPGLSSSRIMQRIPSDDPDGTPEVLMRFALPIRGGYRWVAPLGAPIRLGKNETLVVEPEAVAADDIEIRGFVFAEEIG
jgi:hypothetical protein